MVEYSNPKSADSIIRGRGEFHFCSLISALCSWIVNYQTKPYTIRHSKAETNCLTLKLL